MTVDGAEDPVVEATGLKKYFEESRGLLGRKRQRVRAVDGVDLSLRDGETFGLVGESGCGKSTLGRTLLRLYDPTAGTIRFEGRDITELSKRELRPIRREMQLIFQDPFSSLNPRQRVGEIVEEPLAIQGVDKREREERARRLLDQVGLKQAHYGRYPHAFSGGQRQRIGIARSLIVEPEFIVADEPVSALDVSIQAQILNLLDDIQEEFGLTMLVIAHDLSIVRHIADRVGVMYLGELVEVAPTEELFADPKHPYTQALLSSAPIPDPHRRDREKIVLEGEPPSPIDPPSGCRFRTRCPKVIPPADLDVDQGTFREAMDLRQRVEARAIDLDAVRQRADAPAGVVDATAVEEAPTDGPASDGSDPDDRAFVDGLLDQFFDTPPEGDVRGAVVAAAGHLADGNWERAEAVLADRFETVCERERPVLPEEDHPAACHLY